MSWESSQWKKSPGWDKLSRQMKRRAGYHCQWRDPATGRRCINGNGRNGDGLATDHIVPKSLGGNDDPSNLRVLCTEHHNAKTAEDRRANRKVRRDRFRRIEDHPGLIDPNDGEEVSA